MFLEAHYFSDEWFTLDQLAEFDKKPSQKLLKKDIKLHGYIIKGVPVYHNFKNEPSENVSGQTLAKLHTLIIKNKNKKIIKFD